MSQVASKRYVTVHANKIPNDIGQRATVSIEIRSYQHCADVLMKHRREYFVGTMVGLVVCSAQWTAVKKGVADKLMNTETYFWRFSGGVDGAAGTDESSKLPSHVTVTTTDSVDGPDSPVRTCTRVATTELRDLPDLYEHHAYAILANVPYPLYRTVLPTQLGLPHPHEVTSPTNLAFPTWCCAFSDREVAVKKDSEWLPGPTMTIGNKTKTLTAVGASWRRAHVSLSNASTEPHVVGCDWPNLGKSTNSVAKITSMKCGGDTCTSTQHIGLAMASQTDVAEARIPDKFLNREDGVLGLKPGHTIGRIYCYEMKDADFSTSCFGILYDGVLVNTTPSSRSVNTPAQQRLATCSWTATTITFVSEHHHRRQKSSK